jgi:tripartite-type tricarboxylate transporter receptor subunit TctC
MHALPRCAATALLLLAVPVDGKAQDYPARPVTIIVPLTAAGAPDILARIIAQQLQARLGGSFVVENRAGGGTTIGSNAVAKAAPDGYTLLMATSSSLAINVTLQKALPYDPLNDFVPLAAVAQSPFILLVNPTVPVKAVAELIGYAKSNSDKLSFASAGNGTPHHLFAEMFLSMSGAKLPQARYRGSAPALNDLIAGHVTVMFCDVPSSAAAIGAGTVRALGVTTKSRLPGFPEVPPIAEAGLPGFEGAAWLMIAAPAKTPEPVARKLNAEINAILELPATKEQLVKLNLTAMNIPAIADMRDFVRSEIGRWGEVVRRAGIAGSEQPE